MQVLIKGVPTICSPGRGGATKDELLAELRRRNAQGRDIRFKDWWKKAELCKALKDDEKRGSASPVKFTVTEKKETEIKEEKHLKVSEIPGEVREKLGGRLSLPPELYTVHTTKLSLWNFEEEKLVRNITLRNFKREKGNRAILAQQITGSVVVFAWLSTRELVAYDISNQTKIAENKILVEEIFSLFKLSEEEVLIRGYSQYHIWNYSRNTIRSFSFPADIRIMTGVSSYARHPFDPDVILSPATSWLAFINVRNEEVKLIPLPSLGRPYSLTLLVPLEGGKILAAGDGVYMLEFTKDKFLPAIQQLHAPERLFYNEEMFKAGVQISPGKFLLQRGVGNLYFFDLNGGVFARADLPFGPSSYQQTRTVLFSLQGLGKCAYKPPFESDKLYVIDTSSLDAKNIKKVEYPGGRGEVLQVPGSSVKVITTDSVIHDAFQNLAVKELAEAKKFFVRQLERNIPKVLGEIIMKFI